MATPVTKANYAHAETAVILSDYVKKIAKGTGSGGVGVMLHQRAGHDPDDRTILRPNFDTMYSFAVLDLTCAATVVLPQTERYQILEVIDEEHWIPLIAAEPGRYELTKESVGSRFAFAFVRTRVNMQDPADLRLAAEVQDGIAVEQAEPGSYQQPLTYDMDEILALRKAYNERKGKEGVTSEMIFGARDCGATVARAACLFTPLAANRQEGRALGGDAQLWRRGRLGRAAQRGGRLPLPRRRRLDRSAHAHAQGRAQSPARLLVRHRLRRGRLRPRGPLQRQLGLCEAGRGRRLRDPLRRRPIAAQLFGDLPRLERGAAHLLPGGRLLRWQLDLAAAQALLRCTLSRALRAHGCSSGDWGTKPSFLPPRT